MQYNADLKRELASRVHSFDVCVGHHLHTIPQTAKADACALWTGLSHADFERFVLASPQTCRGMSKCYSGASIGLSTSQRRIWTSDSAEFCQARRMQTHFSNIAECKP